MSEKEVIPTEKPKNKAKSRFAKEQIVKMDRYRNRADLLGALLRDGQKYTHDDVVSILNNFMKGRK